MYHSGLYSIFPWPSPPMCLCLMLTNYNYNNSISKSSHSLKYWGLGFQHIFGGNSVQPMGFPVASAGDRGLIPGSERSPGERNGNPLQYPCLGNPMDRGAWWASLCPRWYLNKTVAQASCEGWKPTVIRDRSCPSRSTECPSSLQRQIILP